MLSSQLLRESGGHRSRWLRSRGTARAWICAALERHACARVLSQLSVVCAEVESAVSRAEAASPSLSPLSGVCRRIALRDRVERDLTFWLGSAWHNHLAPLDAVYDFVRFVFV
jgi:hypothetical protein